MPKPKVDATLDSVKKFWTRFSSSMELWFPDLAGPREWAAKLKASEHDIYNWKKRRPGRPPTRPRRGVPQLAEMYDAGGIRARGGDPLALARHVYTGEGQMPRPSGAGAIVPNVSAPSEPAPLPVQSAAHPVVDALSLFERTREALLRGEDPSAIVEFAIETLRRARKIGIGAVAAVLIGGTASAQDVGRAAPQNTSFLAWASRRRARGLVTRMSKVRVTTTAVVLKRATGS